MAEYVRQIPDTIGPLARPPGLARQLHVDLPLLGLLLALTAYGLLVLYSASGQSRLTASASTLTPLSMRLRASVLNFTSLEAIFSSP